MSTKNLSTRLALNAILRCSYTVLPKTLIQLQIYYNFMTQDKRHIEIIPFQD